MSKLNTKDLELQEAFDYLRTFTDQEYGWFYDVSETWYLPQYLPRGLSAQDAFYEDSSWRFF
jgi:hypothetical protein